MKAYTARELARLRLPGVPTSPDKVRAKAARLGWRYEEVVARGGPRRLYAVDSLPPEAQAALTLRATPEPVASGPAPARDEAPESHWQIAAHRAQACQLVAELLARSTARESAYQIAAEHTGAGSSRSVRRWWATVEREPRSEWTRLLLPAWVGRGGRASCHPQAWEAFKSDYLRASAPSAAACYRRTLDLAKANGWQPVPSLNALQRRLQAEVPRAVVVAAREGREAIERLYPAQERRRDHLHALEAVNADGHRCDVMVRWPDGSVGRPVLLGFQDLYSGKVLAWRVDRTEHGDLVRLTFGDLVERWGVPRHLYLDNGRGFANKWFTGRSEWRFRFKVRAEEPVGLLKQLGVEVHWVTPYHGQAKPIERAWRDLVESIARHPSCEGAYTGSNPARKPHNYGQRTVDLEDFLRLVEAQIREHNARTGRRSRVCAGRSLDAAFDESYTRATIPRVTEAQRRLLFLATEATRVRKGTGSVHLLGNRYWAPELVELEGQDVVLRFDPSHAKRGVYAYTLDGRYICHAECFDAVGFDDRSQAREHARRRKAFMKATRAALEAERTLTAAELGELHLAAQGAPAKRPKTRVTRLVVPQVAVEPTPDECAQRERAEDLILAAGRAAREALARRVAG